MRALVCWLLLCVSGISAPPLTCRVMKREAALRKGGAIVLEAELTNHSSSLIEGRLEAAVLRTGIRVSNHAGLELVIPPGRFKTHLLLPPPLDPAYGEGYAVRLSFAERTRTTDFGDHPLGQFPLGGEEFVIAIARTGRRVSEADTVRERSIRLETLRPALDATAWFATASISVKAEDLPAQSVAWTAYDVVVLDAASFAEMKARQLEAFERWIRAGGSAVLFVGEGNFRERHLDFLRRLAGDSPALQTDAQGRLELRNNLRIAGGLGRLLLAGAPPSTRREADANAWRMEIAWLWKVREKWFDDIARDGQWPARRANEFQWQARSGPDLEHWVRAYAMEMDRAATERPRPLPAGWVALLLASLLILAGPADWYLLGWIRRRRWTWVAFPALCGLFAWMASALAAQHLGPQTRTVTVRVTDVETGGGVLREVIYRMRVPSKDEEWVTETTDGLATAMQPLEVQSAPGRFEPAGEMPETRAEWRSPSKVMLRQNLRQWSPNWQQAVSFAPRPVEDPGWRQLVSRWNRYTIGSEENLASMHGDFYVLFHSSSNEFLDGRQVLPADSPISQEVAFELCEVETPLPDLLGARSPVVTGKEMLSLNAREPLVILAWRRTAEGLEVLRRHVSEAEIRSVQ